MDLPERTFEICTKRLVLRQARDEDAETLNAAFSDPEVMRFWSEPPHPSLTRTKEWVASMTGSRQNGRTDFIIELKDGNKAIGKIGVWQDQEIGFLLGREHWGKGLAFEALQPMLLHLFGTIGFEYLIVDIDPRNQASEKLLKRVGFEENGYQERSMQVGDEWVDSQYLKLTRDKWKKSVDDQEDER